MLTRHGHHIPNTPDPDEEPTWPRAHCGGPGLCPVCFREALPFRIQGPGLSKPTIKDALADLTQTFRTAIIEVVMNHMREDGWLDPEEAAAARNAEFQRGFTAGTDASRGRFTVDMPDDNEVAHAVLDAMSYWDLSEGNNNYQMGYDSDEGREAGRAAFLAREFMAELEAKLA